MTKKRSSLTLILCICLTFFGIWWSVEQKKEHAMRAVRYYPLDSEIFFDDAATHLSFETIQQEHYRIRLDSYSKTSAEATLRQDLSLLYQDGVLIGKAFDWDHHVDTMIQTIKMRTSNSHVFQAITFHHSEFHRSDAENIITSQQTLSQDRLYIAATRGNEPQSFRQPESDSEIKIKEQLDERLKHQLQFEWRLILNKFGIKSKDYYMIPLTQLAYYDKQEPLPGIEQEKTAAVMGEIWEGLYHHYILGFSDQYKNIDPIGSIVPLILIRKDGAQIHVLYRTGEARYHQLTRDVSDL